MCEQIVAIRHPNRWMFAAKGSLRKALHKRHTAHESKAQHKNQTDDDSKPTTTKHKDKTLLSFVRREGKLIRKTFGEICGAETVLQDATQPKSGQLKARSRLQSGYDNTSTRPLSVNVEHSNYSYLNTGICPATYHGQDRHYRSISPNIFTGFRKSSAPIFHISPISPTVFVASKHEHPTVYDFEDWKATLEGSKYFFEFFF